ncbi:MAG: ATP-binding protein, partial [Burkholderiales bacterium]
LYRVEGSRSRAGGGSGLGLAIARALVEGHGGTMSAHASALGGLEIRIVFPGEMHD